MPDPTQILLVGLGRIARLAHLPAIAQLDGAEVVAIVDPHLDTGEPEDGSAPTGARRYGSLAAALDAATYDVAVVAVPTPEHAAVIAACTASGLAVVTEKPAAVCSDEAQALLVGSRVQAVDNFRHESGPRALQQLAASGALGPIQAVRIRHVMAEPFRGAWPDRERWREQPPDRGGGVLLDLAYHGLYLTAWLGGGPMVPVEALIERVGTVETTARILTANDAGVTGEIDVSWSALADALTVEVVGADGAATWKAPDDLQVHARGRSSGIPLDEPGLVPAYRRFFAQAFDRLDQPSSPGSIGLDILLQVERARALAAVSCS